LNRTEKKETITGLNKVFQDSDLVIVTHNNGLNAAQTDELRRATRAAGITCRVAKNRLAQIAIKGTDFEGISDLFKGPTVMLLGKDLIATAKTAATFAKNNPAFVVVGGASGKEVMDLKAINTLATLPSMDELRGKLVGILQAPAAQLARVVQAYADKEQTAA
jgi:large subunit ribosomal protein L10